MNVKSLISGLSSRICYFVRALYIIRIIFEVAIYPGIDLKSDQVTWKF